MPLLDYAGARRRWSRGAQHAFAGIFVSAIELAAPVLIALIITDAAFGVVSRVVPQLNVFAVGFPAKIDRRPARSSASRCRSSAGWIADQLQHSRRRRRCTSLQVA